MNTIFTATIFVVIFIIGALMMLPFKETQTETAFTKVITIKNSYNYITIYKNNNINTLNNSGSKDTNKSNTAAAIVSAKEDLLLPYTINNKTNKNMSLQSKGTTTPLNPVNNKNIPILAKQSGNHSTSSLPSAKTVLIVKGAALLREKAYSPNPTIIHVGDSVNWKNMDDVVHTVTSGSSFSSPDRGQEFDSGLLGGSYTHLFMKPGVYSYFCQIHPTMVGKIIVK
ncbi:MAG: plastocyanin/azurin family copper-binding protein [Candidatus Nitrosocosmicus sp.]